MSSQLALTRSTAITNTGVSKVNSKSVPAFLNKLYNMVDDPSTDPLIRWSTNGDSFLVLDHEHFSREVLGRWFKHQNFASFVRQLNMYGFHKVPHLQQGVLRNESEVEVINFENPNFLRGQPDLLCLITRKKQPLNTQGDLGLLLEDVQQESATTPRLTNNTGTVLDIKTVINGIASIKRHQTAISAELKTLQQSNQHLWQEAIAARERHKKNEDTINRILRFLAGVFGTSSSASPKPSSPENTATVVPMKRARLMIGNGTDGTNEESQWKESDADEDVDLPINFSEIGDEGRFSVVEPQHHDIIPEDLLNRTDNHSTTFPSTSPQLSFLPTNNPVAPSETTRDELPVPNASQLSESESQPDPSFSDSILKYINSASPSEMSRLLSVFNNVPHADLWPQSGLSLATSQSGERQGTALTRSSSRVDKSSSLNGDIGLQNPDKSFTLPPVHPPNGNLTTFNSEANYQNMFENTDDIQSRIDSIDFDINSLIQTLPDVDSFDWNFGDGFAVPPIPENATEFTQPSQAEIAARPVDDVNLLPPDQELQSKLDMDPNGFGNIPFTTPAPAPANVGFVTEISPSAASSPSTVSESFPNITHIDHKRKASKTTRTSVKSQSTKKRRISK